MMTLAGNSMMLTAALQLARCKAGDPSGTQSNAPLLCIQLVIIHLDIIRHVKQHLSSSRSSTLLPCWRHAPRSVLPLPDSEIVLQYFTHNAPLSVRLLRDQPTLRSSFALLGAMPPVVANAFASASSTVSPVPSCTASLCCACRPAIYTKAS